MEQFHFLVLFTGRLEKYIGPNTGPLNFQVEEGSPLTKADVQEMSRQDPASLVVSENYLVSPDFLDIFITFQLALNVAVLS